MKRQMTRQAMSDREVEGAAQRALRLSAAVYGVDPGEIAAASRRSAAVASARQTAIYLAHVGLGLPLSAVADAFGRHRTTASHACARIEERREDPEFDACLEALETALRGAAAVRRAAR